MRRLGFLFAGMCMTKYKQAKFAENRQLAKHYDLKDCSRYEFRSRDQILKKVLEDPNYDVLIVGGGIAGAGALLSASRKGFKAFLIDANDFAAGASSKSSKILNSGRSHFANAFKFRNANRKEDFHLADELLKERGALMSNAPYLTNEVGLIIPTTNIFRTAFYYFQCLVYHQWAVYKRDGVRGLLFKNETRTSSFQTTRPQILFKKTLHQTIPSLSSKFKYGVLFFETQSDDSSLVVDCLLTSTALNDPAIAKSDALNYARLVDFVKNENGEIVGAKILDKISGSVLTVNCKVAINAAGVFCDEIRKLASPEAQSRHAFEKIDHVSLSNANETFFPHTYKNIGIYIPKMRSGQSVFLLPWLQTLIAGAHTMPASEPVIHPYADDFSIEQIIKSLKEYFPEADYSVQSKWSGIYPLLAESQAKASDFQSHLATNGKSSSNKLDLDASSQDNNFNTPHQPNKESVEKKETTFIKSAHLIDKDEKTGLITILGGELTLFRKLGEDAINEAALSIKKRGLISLEAYNAQLEKSTLDVKFIGDFQRNQSSIAAQSDDGSLPSVHFKNKERYLDFLKDFIQTNYPFVEADIMEHLVRRYGHRSIVILDEMANNEATKLRLEPNCPYTKAEIQHIINSEFIELPIDLLMRRLRVAFMSKSFAKRVLPQVIDIYGDLRGWEDSQKLEEYRINSNLLDKMDF